MEMNFGQAYPLLRINIYREETLDLDIAAGDADVVLVHEWTEPSLIRRIGRIGNATCILLLFHDTHHRSVSDPAMPDLEGFDGVLGVWRIGERTEIERSAWARRVWTWHEAADTRVFYPRSSKNLAVDLSVDRQLGRWRAD